MYTLQGNPDTHNTYTFHASPCMPFVRFLRVIPVRDNLSRWLNRVGQIHCSREKVLPIPPLSPVEWPMGPTLVSLPNTTIEVVHLSQTSIDEQATSVYWTHITSMNRLHRFTCSRGLTHRSLTDTGGCYNLRGVGLPHHTPRPSQPTVLHFPPKSSARSQVNLHNNYKLN
jgi:hypothetical protein